MWLNLDPLFVSLTWLELYSSFVIGMQVVVYGIMELISWYKNRIESLGKAEDTEKEKVTDLLQQLPSVWAGL